MKQSEKTLHECAMLEHLEAADCDRFSTRQVFVVLGQNGLWRRVPRKGSALKPGHQGSVLCLWEGKVIELLRDGYIEEELHQAGFVFANGGKPVPPRTPLEQAGELFDSEANGHEPGTVKTGSERLAPVPGLHSGPGPAEGNLLGTISLDTPSLAGQTVDEAIAAAPNL